MDLSTEVCALPLKSKNDPRVIHAAEQLAVLMIETQEFQDLNRLARAVRTDPKASDLMHQINGSDYPSFAYEDDFIPLDELKARLETLPVMHAYRTAEKAASDLFTCIDRAVSESLSLDFAENVRACGYG